MNLVEDLIMPFPTEDENSFVKRKAYFIRIASNRISYGYKMLDAMKGNAIPINLCEKEEIDAFWAKYLTNEARDKLVNYKFYDVYKSFQLNGMQLWQYIPSTFYYAFIDDYFTNPQHSAPCDNKNFYDLLFHDIKMPKTIFRKNKIYMDEDYIEISRESAISKARDCGEVILKAASGSGGGQGILFWDYSKDTEALLLNYLNEQSNVICQEVITQHESLSRINSTSVNTIRIMTLLFQGQVHVLSSVLRMGVNGARLDNASVGGIVSGILLDGRIKNFAYDLAANKYSEHPNGIRFDSVVVPGFDVCVDLSIMLAKRLCFVSRLISWDFAIDEQGCPILIEMNPTFGGLEVNQLTNGPIFGDMTDDIFREVFAKSYTLNSILKSM